MLTVGSRDRLFTALRAVDPVGVEDRRQDLQRHREEYIVPGPDYIWSLDGYCKLAHYGFEIYAAIDAYSRYVVWFYVGISARTSVSVLKQYLSTTQDLGVIPAVLRTDRGAETSLCAQAHWLLRREASYKIDPSSSICFEDCYYYSTSIANQQIEAWWAQLSKGAVFQWRVSFKLSGLYNANVSIRTISKP